MDSVATESLGQVDDGVMRTGYAHEAVLLLVSGTDEWEPGAVITTALCGSWTHSGRCPLAPHHTATRREGDRLVVRVVFAAEAPDEPTVRERIIAALEGDRTATPKDAATGWRVLEHHTADVTGDERDRAARLAQQ